MASDVPVSVTARSVEFGNISLATWIEHPVTSRISLIFDPPLPFAMRKFKIREEEREEGKWENSFYNADTKIPLNHLRNNGLVCTCVCVCVFAAPKNERWNRFEIFIIFFLLLLPFFSSHSFARCQPSSLMEIFHFFLSLRLYGEVSERERGNKCVLLIIIHQLFSSNFLYFWRMDMTDMHEW